MEPENSSHTTRHNVPARRRRRFSPEEKADILERFRASGLSQVKFAAKEGIAVGTLIRWLRDEREKQADQPGISAVELGRLGSLGTPAAWAEVVRPDGWSVRLSGTANGQNLKTLFASLPPCSS